MPRKAAIGEGAGIRRVIVSTDMSEDAVKLLEERRTQGRKGMKAARVNTSFSPSNMDYLRKIAGLEGMTITAYLNELVRRDIERRGDALKQAWAILEASRPKEKEEGE